MSGCSDPSLEFISAASPSMDDIIEDDAKLPVGLADIPNILSCGLRLIRISLVASDDNNCLLKILGMLFIPENDKSSFRFAK
eukprot:CAMPEP_0195519540 /NCGR_PEP_ID=MMETSP0794_2-20130614/15019_1 /TAXON_ID=515487 /ORGANISM="Stephanopyxis turris, Strain CCMP 815" /LENGTH=81 /DNA_ID=CAMNT_0040648713 /DNA_START=663 /DNA_END=905 /DNA_ORIENTATION=-